MNLGKILLYPKAISLAYADCILKIIKETGEMIKEDVVSKISILRNSNRINKDSKAFDGNYFAKDDYIDDLQKIQKKMEKFLDLDNVMVFGCILLFGKKLLKFSKKQLKESIKKMKDEEVGEKKDLDQMLKSFITSNADLMKLIRKNLLYKVIKTIKDGFNSDEEIEQIEENIFKNIEMAENNAKSIAKNEIIKLHSNYLRYELKKLGIYEYIWVTMEDDRVRKSHEVLNQKIMTWKNPNVYKNIGDSKWKKKSSIGGVPKQTGEDYNCRCGFIPILDKES